MICALPVTTFISRAQEALQGTGLLLRSSVQMKHVEGSDVSWAEATLTVPWGKRDKIIRSLKKLAAKEIDPCSMKTFGKDVKITYIQPKCGEVSHILIQDGTGAENLWGLEDAIMATRNPKNIYTTHIYATLALLGVGVGFWWASKGK